MAMQRIEISGYAEIAQRLKEGAVFCKIAAAPFDKASRLVVHDVRKSHGFMQVKLLEGWVAGPFEIFWIERPAL